MTKEEILQYLDTELHPIVSPENYHVYSALYDMVCELDEQKTGEWNDHTVACLLAEVFGETCACNLNDNDEWLPYKCEYVNTVCPNPGGVACWEQFLKHRENEV